MKKISLDIKARLTLAMIVGSQRGTVADIVRILLSSLAFTAALSAQPTTVPLPALRGGSVVGLVACIIPAGSPAENGCLYRVVTLGQGIGIDTSTAPPTLRVGPAPPPPSSAPIVEKSVILRPGRGFIATLPDAGYIQASLKVWVNGLRYSAPDDFTITPAPAALSFRVAFEPGDIVVADYVVADYKIQR